MVVAEMHLIFQSAQQVVVWLGQPVRPWSFRVVLDIPDEDDPSVPFYFRGKGSWKIDWIKTLGLCCNLGDYLGSAVAGWYKKYASPVVYRFNLVTIFLSWEHFEKVAVKLASLLPDFLKFQPLRERKKYVAIRRAISGLAEARLQLHKGPTMTLSSLLPFARSKCTTDPRDKIFAFTKLLPAVPASLQVDYGEETKTTFKKVAQLMLSEDVGLRLLAECESNTNINLEGLAACLPSWVLDWAQSRICEPLPGGLSPSLKGHEFCAGSEAVNFEILDDTLVLEALIWDEVIFVDPLASVTGSSPRIQCHCWPTLVSSVILPVVESLQSV